jgi:hypothetical protein
METQTETVPSVPAPGPAVIELCAICNQPVDLTLDCWIHYRVSARPPFPSFIVAAMHVACGDLIAVRP